MRSVLPRSALPRINPDKPNQIHGLGVMRGRLNLTKEPFAQIPHGRYVNFMSDFFAERGATRERALRGWKKAKEAQRTQELSFVGEAQLQAKAPGYARCCVRFQYIDKESV
jgi:hypothetical protein